MPNIERVLETALYFDDLSRAGDFYQRILGALPLYQDERLVALDAGAGTVLLLFRRGGSAAGVTVPAGHIPPHDGSGPVHVALAIPASDFESWEAHLAAAGVAVEARVAWPRGGRSLYFRDPEGHSIELATPGIWPTY
jgi:catechol 2,3-dioxygenase-like lactoylglutathione lyase family enzyme